MSTMTTCRHTGFANDASAPFCGECGAPLTRCMAHETCGGIVDATGFCPSCIAPQLFLDAGAVQKVTAGGTLALPLMIANASPSKRPVFVTGLWTREGGNDWESCDLVWDRLDAGAIQPALVRANDLDKPGAHQLEILFAVATRWQWREEVFLFSTSLSLTAEGQRSITVNQTINTSSAQGGMGNTAYAPIRINTGETEKTEAILRPAPLPLVRATKAETAFGLRGQDGVRIMRRADFRFRGFGPTEAPVDGPIVTGDALLSFGRARTKQRGGPIDARISLTNPDGSLDVEGSNHLSRRHFDLYIENDRLMIRAESETGVRINSRDIPRGEPVVLKAGDVIHPLRKSPHRLAIRVRFDTHAEGVSIITLTRTPASPEEIQS